VAVHLVDGGEVRRAVAVCCRRSSNGSGRIRASSAATAASGGWPAGRTAVADQRP
jgi:hypothetical protein